jgi:hypothetical protein
MVVAGKVQSTTDHELELEVAAGLSAHLLHLKS